MPIYFAQVKTQYKHGGAEKGRKGLYKLCEANETSMQLSIISNCWEIIAKT